jgi:hypothetical protein
MALKGQPKGGEGAEGNATPLHNPPQPNCAKWKGVGGGGIDQCDMDVAGNSSIWSSLGGERLMRE